MQAPVIQDPQILQDPGRPLFDDDAVNVVFLQPHLLQHRQSGLHGVEPLHEEPDMLGHTRIFHLEGQVRPVAVHVQGGFHQQQGGQLGFCLALIQVGSCDFLLDVVCETQPSSSRISCTTCRTASGSCRIRSLSARVIRGRFHTS